MWDVKTSEWFNRLTCIIFIPTNRKRRGKATIVQDDDVIPSNEGGDEGDMEEDEGGTKRKGKRRVISKAFVSSSEGSEDEATERVCSSSLIGNGRQSCWVERREV